MAKEAGKVRPSNDLSLAVGTGPKSQGTGKTLEGRWHESCGLAGRKHSTRLRNKVLKGNERQKDLHE